MGKDGRMDERGRSAVSNDNPSIAEIRAEYLRLTRQLIKGGLAYEAWEAEVRKRHDAGAQNYSGDIRTVLGNDVILNSIASTSRTVATIATALATVLQAEMAISVHNWRTSPAGAAASMTGVVQQRTTPFGDRLVIDRRGPRPMQA